MSTIRSHAPSAANHIDILHFALAWEDLEAGCHYINVPTFFRSGR